MNSPSIYQYESVRQYLSDALDARQKQETDFSLRKWAKEMGMKSHTQLLMLMQGKRPIRVKHAPTLSKGLKLSSQERLFFQALIQFEQSDSIEEKELCRVWLSDLRPQGAFRTRELEEFMVISHWVHCAIMAMTELKDAIHTAEEVCARLRGKVTLHEVRHAIERLIELNLVERTAEGNLRATYQSITSKDDVANAGVREYHRQVTVLAVDALEKQTVEEREFQSFAFSIRKNKLPLAKELIRKFRSQFIQAVSEKEGDDVMQMSMQLFKLT